MGIHRGLVALSLSACLAGGCATSQGGSLTARFVKTGEPAVDLGGSPPVTIGSTKRPSKAPPAISPAPVPQAVNLGTSVESSDRGLSAALIRETVLPTAENHLRVAMEYRRLGILDASADRLSRALRKAPRSSDAHEALARVWRDWGLPDLGLGPAYRAVYYAPASASAQNTLGTVLESLGRFDMARSAFERALSLDPAAGWALNNLCYVELRLGRLEQARARCEAALSLTPNLAAAHNNLALVLASSGDMAGARDQFLAAGDSAAASYNLGIVHLADREYASAADSFEDAIRKRPAFTAAKERAHAARLRLLTGDK